MFLHAALVFIRNATNIKIESIQGPLNRFIVVNRFNHESIHPGELIQLPLALLPSSFVYTHPIELGVGPLGS